MSWQLPRDKYATAEREHLSIPNVLARSFKPEKPNQIWCGDVTYVWAGYTLLSSSTCMRDVLWGGQHQKVQMAN